MSAFNLPSLAHFLGAYFNQDCFHSDPTIEAIVKRFQREEPADFVDPVQRQLRDLVALNLSEARLDLFLRESGCDYDPLVEFQSRQQWLAYLSELLTTPPDS